MVDARRGVARTEGVWCRNSAGYGGHDLVANDGPTDGVVCGALLGVERPQADGNLDVVHGAVAVAASAFGI